MHVGTVTSFIESKGFGFITPSDGGEVVFVHKSALVGQHIGVGQTVTFDIVKDNRGSLAAANVTLV